MTPFARLVAIGLTSICALPALADLDVRFDEGAPKDRFSFVNTGGCAIRNAILTLDLGGSAAGLIFDVTASGAGVEVFQPLEIVDGKSALSTIPRVRDGDNRLAFEVAELAPGAAIAFTIDVDDTIGAREITVSNSEILGARVLLEYGGTLSDAAFETGARTKVSLPDC